MTGVPVRAGSDRTFVRVIALMVLLLAAGAATRGYLPGAAPAPRWAVGTAGPVEPMVLAALLTVSTAIIAVAVVHRARHQRAAVGGIGWLSVTAGAGRRRPAWQVVLIVVGVPALLLLTILMLATLSDGYRVEIPAATFGTGEAAPVTPGAPAPAAPSNPGGPPGVASGYLLALAAMLLVLIAAAVVAARVRHPDPTPPETTVIAAAGGVSSTGETLVRAAELGLTRIVDRSREPRQAIIACYAVMEQHLGTVPDAAPRDFDTPTEVLTRAVEHHVLSPDNAARLVALFTEARFSAHLMTERHRAGAVEALRMVLEELRARS